MNENHKPVAESQLQVALGMLLDTAADKNLPVAEIVNTSLRKIADKHTSEVLKSCSEYGKQIPKTNHDHLSAVLNIMKHICQDYLSQIDENTVSGVIIFSLEVMIQSTGNEPEIQAPASEILVALGVKYHVQVLDALLSKMETGVLPHFMVPQTIGTLASVNPDGVVPYLKKIMVFILPVIGTLKVDIMRQSFAYALGCIAEALLEYSSNDERPQDFENILQEFHVQMGIVFEVLFVSWLHAKESKVVESVLYSLSSIYFILSSDLIIQQTPKVVITLLSLYKKHHYNPFYITKCLGAVVLKASRVNGVLLEPLLTSILHALFDKVCISPDYDQPDLQLTHSEVLRCYECLGSHFTDTTIDFFISQLKNNNEKDKIRALLVITHLTNSAEFAVLSKSKDLVKCINDLTGETNINVKKALLKTVVAFSCKGLLSNEEINPNGPTKFMEFILQLCCKQHIPKNSAINSPDLWDIQKSAETTLYMLSTSITDLQACIWNLLIKCFLSHTYDDASIIILRCLTHLGSKKSSMDNGEGLLVRCLGSMTKPLADFKGTFVLNFLKNLKLTKDESYKGVFESKIPHLLKYLEQNYDNFNHTEWCDLILDFFSILLDAVKDAEFNRILIQRIKEQLSFYNSVRHNGGGDEDKLAEKSLLMKFLAITVSNLEDKGLVLQSLDIILENVKLNDNFELQASAEAVGYCSRQHLQIVLDKLAMIRKGFLHKKTSKFFPFMKDQKHEVEVERVRYFVICSYTEVCNEAPAEMLLRIIENEILDFVINELTNCKDYSIRKACLRAIGCAADAMHPNRNVLHIKMQDRSKILDLVLSQMHLHSGSDYIELFPVIIPVLTSLVKLPVLLESEQRINLLKYCFTNIFNASAIYCKINADGPGPYYGNSKLIPFITSSFTKLNQLVQELLLQNLNPATIDEMITLLEGWFNKKKVEQRLPAMETLRVVLQTYLDNMKFTYDSPSTFGQTGSLLAEIVPRCTDSNKNICKVSVECLSLVLCIASRYEGHMRDHDKILINSLQHIQQQIDTDEPKLLYNLTTDMAHIVGLNIPQFQLYHFVNGLADSLLDKEINSAIGTSVVLHMTLKNKGTELLTHVNEVFTKLLQQLEQIQNSQVRAGTLRALLSLAMHHPKMGLGVLLGQQLPYSQTVCDCWAVFSTDSTLVTDILDQLKKIMKQTPLYEEQNESIRIINLTALQAVCGFHELFRNRQLKDVCKQQYPELFSILLVTLASYIGTDCPSYNKKNSAFSRDAYKLNPAKVALDAFKLFLLCCENTMMATSLLLCVELNKDENLHSFQEMVSSLVFNLCSEAPDSLSWLVACLGPCIRAELEPQRIAAIAFFANLLKYKANEQTVLAENLLEMLLDVLNDQNCEVRKLALRGLGYGVENLSSELVQRHCHPILSALMQGLDYHNVSTESAVILEAMLSFSKLLVTMEGQKLSSFQVTTLVRLKPLLNQEDVELRYASIRLLGDLTLSLNQENKQDAFKEQIQGNLITLLLHLADPEERVVRACKYTLRKLGPFLDSPKVNSMVQEHLVEEGNLHFTNFVTDLVKIMAEELQELFPLLIMTSLSYFKSPWVQLRAQSALMAGLLFSQMTVENKEPIMLDRVCDRLLKLMNDEHPDVRVRAVQAITYLFLN